MHYFRAPILFDFIFTMFYNIHQHHRQTMICEFHA